MIERVGAMCEEHLSLIYQMRELHFLHRFESHNLRATYDKFVGNSVRDRHRDDTRRLFFIGSADPAWLDTVSARHGLDRNVVR